MLRWNPISDRRTGGGCPEETVSRTDTNGKARKQSSRGFTLIEVVFAISLLTIALMGLALAMPVAIQSNNRNRVDSEGTMLVQRQLEQMLAQTLSAASFTDADGNVVSLAPGGSPLTNGKVDFTMAAIAGYSATLTGSSGAQYELRWNVQSLPDGTKQFTIAARKRGGERFLLPPVNVSGRVGK